MARLHYTLVKVPLDGDIDADDTTVTFTAPLREFGEDDIATIVAPDTLTLRCAMEIMHVTAYTSGALTATVLRGQEGSTATAHDEGDILRHVLTAEDFDEFGTPTAAEVSITDAGAYFTGTDVEAALQEVGAALGSGVTDGDKGEITVTGGVWSIEADASGFDFVLDEDNMASDSATKVPTQQSVKAYVDAEVAGVSGGSGTSPLDLAAFNAVFGTGITTYDQEFDRTDETTLPSGWSWVNQETASYNERFGVGRLTVPSAALDIRAIVRTLPSESTWTATLWASGSQIGNAASDAELFGLFLRQSSDGKNVMLRRASTSGVITTRSSNDNFGSATNYSAARFSYATGIMGFRVRRNSATSYDFEFSADAGISWSQIDMARDMSAHFTPDQIGFCALQSLGWQCQYSVHAFRVR